MTSSGTVCVALLGIALAAYAALGNVAVGPAGLSSDLYTVIAVSALLVGWWQLVLQSPQRPWPWRWLLLGFGSWVVGDVVWAWEFGPDGPQAFPGVSDAFYLLAYVFLAVGAVLLVRVRATGRDRTALLDSLVVTVGVAVPALAFLVVPATADADLSTPGKVVVSAYPLLDVLLVAVLARLLTTPGGRTAAFWLLTASLVLTLAADVGWQAGVLVQGEEYESRLTDLGWLASYVCLVAALASTSMHALSERPPATPPVGSRARLLALAVAAAMPALTLAAGQLGGGVPWWPVAIGGVVLSWLVLARMAGLLEHVRRQAVQLSALARVDPLTGAPNRRTWDHELSRACLAARETGEPLAVALLDLDHFKRFNDGRGHQAGDRLLVAAVSAWGESLPEGAFLARYGGEEFAVLLPGHDQHAAVAVLEGLRGSTPEGQTFSAGVAVWDPSTEPGGTLAAADGALYEAKRRGRDRVVAASGPRRGAGLPTWAEEARVVLQPIVGAGDGRVVAHEALARFPGRRDVGRSIAQAHEDGVGDLVEAHLVQLALGLPGRPPGQSLFVNVTAAALESPRFWRSLPDDLDGVVVELVEDPTVQPLGPLERAVAALRERGAHIAVDDLGAGSGDLGRVVAVRPEVVKIDQLLVRGCHTDAARLRLIGVVVDLAASLGARVCAEGVESQADLDALRDVGVHLVQGHHLARPSGAWVVGALAGPATDLLPGGAAR